jgi:FkbM family methyltransferase
VKRPFRRKIEIAKSIDELRAYKGKIAAVFGTDSVMSNAVDARVKFLRWKLILGGDIARFLRISEPRFGVYALFAQHVGIDLEKEIQSTNDARILDGIKLPLVFAQDNASLWEYELSDIVFPSYFKHNFEGFEDYYALIGNILGDFYEGPCEYGDIVLKEGDVVFDCGANMGLFSAVASRYGAEVFAFEAIPDIIDNYLSKTASMNGNIHVINFAVWDKEETLNFSLVPENIGASRANQLCQDVYGHYKQFVVQAMTLDAFVEGNGIGRVDFIKADIEGAERNVAWSEKNSQGICSKTCDLHLSFAGRSTSSPRNYFGSQSQVPNR